MQELSKTTKRTMEHNRVKGLASRKTCQYCKRTFKNSSVLSNHIGQYHRKEREQMYAKLRAKK